MKVLICLADPELDWSSVVLHSGHITSPSRSASVGRSPTVFEGIAIRWPRYFSATCFLISLFVSPAAIRSSMKLIASGVYETALASASVVSQSVQ